MCCTKIYFSSDITRSIQSFVFCFNFNLLVFGVCITTNCRQHTCNLQILLCDYARIVISVFCSFCEIFIIFALVVYTMDFANDALTRNGALGCMVKEFEKYSCNRCGYFPQKCRIL